MSKLLNLRDYILLTVALAGDTLQEVRSAGGIFPKLLEAQYGFVPSRYKKSSYFSTVSRMLKIGDIERKTNSKGETLLEITSNGGSKFKRRFPLISNGKWDHQFMIVVFDIPETEKYARKVLRDKLRELGFGLLQKSVYISPHHFEEDLKEFLDSKGYMKYACVVKAKELVSENLINLATKAWGLEEINSDYQEIIKEILSSPKPISEAKKSSLWSSYLDILGNDPMLPKDLLPKDWARGEVVRLLEDI